MLNKVVSVGKTINRNELPEWKALEELSAKFEGLDIKAQFDADPNRLEKLTFELGQLFVDVSKNQVNDEIMEALFALAEKVDVKGWANKMFVGEQINKTEGRAVLHIALRNVEMKDGLFVPLSQIFTKNIDGIEEDVMPEVCDVLNRMGVFTDKVRSGEWRGATGKKITTIVNIGIGGSDLGPKMVNEALSPYSQEGITNHYVSNVDGADLAAVLEKCDPQTTMFVIASKTFTTQETMTNANSAKTWFLKSGRTETDVAKHFVAASTSADKVTAFGIDKENMFPFWSWVGGRYSTPSAIGLPVMISVGKENFAELLSGYQKMDKHFLNTPIEKNIPVVMALLGVWYNNFRGAQTTAILPYNQLLSRFAAYFQQGDMESNGKGKNKQGEQVEWETGPIVWGEPGANGQHAFYQLIHQGTKLIPVDFIATLKEKHGLTGHQAILLANVIAQAEALMVGKSASALRAEGCAEELIPHKTFDGNKPSNMLMAEELSPETLGMLLAMYEHKIFTQGIIWDVYSFDQWGVELGKILAKAVAADFEADEPSPDHDPSTLALINKVREAQGK